jgi:hypothetical protein
VMTAAVLRSRQWTIGMRLRQMNQSSDSPRLSRADVATNKSIDQSRLPDAGRAFYQQRFERDHADYPMDFRA